MADFGRLVAALGAALALAACGTTAHQASAAHPPSATQTRTHAPAAAAATSEALVSAQAAPQPAAGTPTAAPARELPRYGNQDGHAYVPSAGRAVSTAHPNHVIGDGTPRYCTSAAVVKAVAEGGIITFNCGAKPITITMKATAKVVNTSHRVVLDGGGKVTLSGGGKLRILYMNTCDPKQNYTTTDCWQQQWPQLIVQNMGFVDAYSAIRQTSTSDYGGGAIFDEGGQLKVVNSGFIDNRCYKDGPDLGGAAIRALGMRPGSPVYLTSDTFRGGRCSNGGALSSIDASWDVFNSLMVNNKTTGWGENPKASGTPGGGSGGAIYTDGDSYDVTVDGTVIQDNDAHGGEGGAIFFVVDADGGTLTIEYSTLHHNPSGGYQNAPGIFDDVDQKVVQPTVIHSTIN
jgi:Chlamydia polymorphic membrane protein (Chlamydia_PMP) repeat